MRWRKWALYAAVVAVAVPGNSCGPFFTDMVFVRPAVPEDLNSFLNGNPGVIDGDLGLRYLALAYRVLSGPALTPQEKESVLHPDLRGQNQNIAVVAPASTAIDSWIKARSEVVPAKADLELIPDRTVPGQEWQTYGNCLNGAFDKATQTLAERLRQHAVDKDDLANWVRGQDAVFSNCAANGEMPAPVSAPEWLVKDRAYQTAAAHFYRADFEEARRDFELIAIDQDSVWRPLASYLVGRCLLREATLEQPDKTDEDLLRKAGEQFKRAAQAGGPYARPAAALENYVDLRLNSWASAARLGDAISHPDANLEHDLEDLQYTGERPKWWAHGDEGRKSDLLDWALTMQGFATPSDHAAIRWRQTGNIAWLVAAMEKLQQPDEELERAAAAFSSDSPAWVTLTYNRLRLLPAGAASRGEAERVLNQLAAKKASLETVNRFTMLAQDKAESLEEYTRLAPMEPVGEEDDSFTPLPPTNLAPGQQRAPTMAGLPVNVRGMKRIDLDTAIVLNRHVPLNNLVELVLHSKWPKQLRYEFAMAVWTRAVLLGRPALARKLTPEMIEGESGWTKWLTAYDAATTDDERQVTGLLALMRFPSVRPYINGGAAREEGFAAYSEFRDNWWCAGMAAYNYSNGYNFSAGYPDPNANRKEKVSDFITASMETEAQAETAQLAKIGDAPAYFGDRVLAWVRAHPEDSRNPEVLGFAFRAMRNGCNLERSQDLKKQVFTLLHSRYATSQWAKQYSRLGSED
jgi:hypothetical protein